MTNLEHFSLLNVWPVFYHDLKVWPVFYSEILSGRKTFELRRDDRGFKCGDTLRLSEWDPEAKEFTGRFIFREVSIVVRGFGLQEGFVCLGLIPT